MNIDISTIVASLTSSVVIAGAIAFVLKKSFEKTLDLKIERLKEQSRADIAESTRRKAQIFDQQEAAFKTVLSLAYRFRNSAREIIEQMENSKDDAARQSIDISEKNRRFKTYSESLIQILYDERAIMPPDLFQVAHELKNAARDFSNESDKIMMPILTRGRSKMSSKKFNSILDDLRGHYKEIGRWYSRITEEVQARLGVES